MRINDETVAKLEKLTMLKVRDKEPLKEKLGEILTFMENLKNAEDTETGYGLVTVYREDKPESKDDLSSFFEGNKKVVDRSFEVPKIL